CFDCFMLRARSHRAQRNASAAVKDYTAAIALKHDVAAAYGERGEIYRLTHQYREAIADFDRAHAYNNNQYYVWKGGLAYSASNAASIAISDFSAIVDHPASDAMKLVALISRAFANINQAYAGDPQMRNHVAAAGNDFAAASSLSRTNEHRCVIALGQA